MTVYIWIILEIMYECHHNMDTIKYKNKIFYSPIAKTTLKIQDLQGVYKKLTLMIPVQCTLTLTLTLEPALVYPCTKSALNWSILYSVEDPMEVGLIWYTVYPHRWAASLTMIVALPGHPSATSTEWEVSWGEAMVRARRHTCSITVWKNYNLLMSFFYTNTSPFYFTLIFNK